jgi:hypothetical protein
MEIGPVPGVQLEPRVRRPNSSRTRSAVFPVEIPSDAEDETYTPADVRAAAGAEEDDNDTDESGTEQDEASENGRRRVNFFA